MAQWGCQCPSLSLSFLCFQMRDSAFTVGKGLHAAETCVGQFGRRIEAYLPQVNHGWSPDWASSPCPLPRESPPGAPTTSMNLPFLGLNRRSSSFPGTWLPCLMLQSVGYCPPPLWECKIFKAGGGFSGAVWPSQV